MLVFIYLARNIIFGLLFWWKKEEGYFKVLHKVPKLLNSTKDFLIKFKCDVSISRGEKLNNNEYNYLWF